MTDIAVEPRRKKKTGRIVLLVAFLLFLLGIGVIWWTLQSKVNQVESIEEAFPEESLRPAVVEVEEGEEQPLNILLLGSDSRADSSESLMTDLGNRADTIMVAHIPSDRDSVQIMSIMRDSWVPIPGYGDAKVNAALAYGGVPLMVQTVETLIDQRIDHVAMIDFNGFKNITDALGGVTIDNPRAFSASPPVNTSFAAGQITLSGDEALAYVRERKNFADGDYSRVENQQRFLQGIFSKIMSRDTLTNPVKLNNLFNSTAPYVAVDSELGLGRMIDLGGSMNSVRGSDISSFTLPTTGTGRVGAQSVVFVDWAELEVVRDNFANDELNGYQPAAR